MAHLLDKVIRNKFVADTRAGALRGEKAVVAHHPQVVRNRIN
ncbi:MAG TPA: hypothetical protein PK539_00970 [Candidatus Paceibacterota bacterium]|nr:hypothetical protein [Candidatus Paceibacterota bacterium]